MSRKEKSRVDTGGGNALGANPFDALGALAGLPSIERESAAASSPQAEAPQLQVRAGVIAQGASAPVQERRFSGRVDVRREKSGRGGKMVTVIAGAGIAALEQAEREALLRQLKNQFGCGGSHQELALELQGNRVDQVIPVLAAMGWRAVRSGG